MFRFFSKKRSHFHHNLKPVITDFKKESTLCCSVFVHLCCLDRSLLLLVHKERTTVWLKSKPLAALFVSHKGDGKTKSGAESECVRNTEKVRQKKRVWLSTSAPPPATPPIFKPFLFMLSWSKALPETPPNPPTGTPAYPQPHTSTRSQENGPARCRWGWPRASWGGSWGWDDRQGGKRKGENNKHGSNPSELLWLNGSLWSCYTLCHPDPPPSPAAGNYDGQGKREEGREGQREGGWEKRVSVCVCVRFNWCTGCCVLRSPLLGFRVNLEAGKLAQVGFISPRGACGHTHTP